MITITSPIANQVFQRDHSNQITVNVSGRNTNTSEQVKIKIYEVGKTALVLETLAVNVLNVAPSEKNDTFTASILLKSGWYNCELSSVTDNRRITFGVGEVFVVTGHSFAEGLGSSFVQDERVIIQSNIKGATVNPTDFTDETVYQSVKDYALTDDNYSRTRGIWGQMGENLVKALNCPVMLYHASWGGTSLKNWSEAVRGLVAKDYPGYNPADDGKGYPFAKLKNILKTLVPKTGARAVLVMHGENDSNSSQTDIEQYYKDLIGACRAIQTDIPFVLSISTWDKNTENQVIQAQKSVIGSVPKVYEGPDITTIGFDGRIKQFDPNKDWHLNETGDKKAAQIWADALVRIINEKPLLGIFSKSIVPVVATANSTEPPKDSVNKGVISAMAVFLVLGLVRIFGVKLPLWVVVLLALGSGGAVFVQEDFPKKI
jgi:hypothetical protein